MTEASSSRERERAAGPTGTQLAITAVHPRRSYAHLVVQLFDDPFDDRRTRARRISQVTRRDIFDYLRTEGVPWWGRLSEVAFLARLYNLEALPSTDRRFKTADSDIRQHRVANYDWDDASHAAPPVASQRQGVQDSPARWRRRDRVAPSARYGPS